MEKIPTLFVRDEKNMKLVTSVINPEALWMLDGETVATIKKDGTNVRVTVKDGLFVKLEKRRNPTREQKQLGQEPSYIDTLKSDPQDQYIYASVDNTDFSNWPDGSWSCEALGPKIQGGIESDIPCLYAFEFNPEVIKDNIEITFESIKNFLSKNEIEGIVWKKNIDGEVKFAKIKRRDFGFQWPVK